MTDEAKALVERATRRASILHASAAWGSDEDGFLIDRLLDLIETQAREIERLRGALEVIRDGDCPYKQPSQYAYAALAGDSHDQ